MFHLLQNVFRLGVCFSYELTRLQVHGGMEPLGVGFLASAPLLERDEADDIVESELLDLGVGHLGHFLEVVRCCQ